MGDLVWARNVLPHTSRDRLACEQALQAPGHSGAPPPECPGGLARKLDIDFSSTYDGLRFFPALSVFFSVKNIHPPPTPLISQMGDLYVPNHLPKN